MTDESGTKRKQPTDRADVVAIDIAKTLDKGLRDIIQVCMMAYDTGLGTTSEEKDARASTVGFQIGVITAVSRVLVDIAHVDLYRAELPDSKQKFLMAISDIWDLVKQEEDEQKRMEHATSGRDENEQGTEFNPSGRRH